MSGIIELLIKLSVLSFFVWLLWNWLMPELFDLKEISYLQAVGLNLLCDTFFNSHQDKE